MEDAILKWMKWHIITLRSCDIPWRPNFLALDCFVNSLSAQATNKIAKLRIISPSYDLYIRLTKGR